VTVDEAIQQALNDLGVGRDNVEIKILHHPRSGFLGIGARRAKVRATLREQVMKDGEEFDMSPAERQARGRRRRRPRRRGGEDQRDAQSGSAQQGDSRGQGRRQDSQKQRDGKVGGQGGRRGDGRSRRDSRDSSGGDNRGQAGGRSGRDGGAKQEAAEGRSQDGQQNKRERGRDGQRGRGGRGRRDRGSKEAGGRNQDTRGEAAPAAEATKRAPSGEPTPEQQPRQSETATAPVRPQAPAGQFEESPRTPAEALDSEVVLSRARELVDELARRMGFEAHIGGHLDTDAEEAVVEVKADAEGLLIGRRGQTLDALEHVVNRMVVGHNQTAEVRVAIDVGGYRERRRESLVELAGRLRERAVAEGRRVQVSPMSARDRRIFQQALAEDATVETRVLGSGFYRRLLVVPLGAEGDAAASDAAGDIEPEDAGADAKGIRTEEAAENEASDGERNGDATG
jgi:spoIIIJ-associated protein